METFDWEEAKKHHSEVVFNFLKEWHDKEIEEYDFGYMISALPKIGKAKKSRNPSTARRMYRRLKERYGFFTR